MKNTLIFLLCLIGLSAWAQPNRDKALVFHRLLIAEKYDSCALFFDDRLREKASPAELQKVWKSLCGQLNGYQSLGNVSSPNDGKMWLLGCVFGKSELDMKLAFDDAGRISGFFFAPSKPKPFFKDASYAAKNTNETALVIENGAYRLPAVLCTPTKGKNFPVVILVHGSGPADKDLSINSTKIFRDIALGLAAQGIATLRYDKRTFVYAEKSSADPTNITIYDETVSDAVAAIALAKTLPNIDSNRVFVLGHSLGGMLAPDIAAKAKSLAGVIVAAGPARPLETLLLMQMRYLYSLQGIAEDNNPQLAELTKQVARVQSPTLSAATPADSLPLSLPASYWLSLRGYSPTAVAAAQPFPYLILQAEADYQVTSEDFALWKKAFTNKSNATFAAYSGLFHLFIPTQSKSGKSTPADYEAAGNVDKRVIDDIAKFIQR